MWIFDNTGIRGLDLRFDVGREKVIVALEINHRMEDKRLELYEKLEAAKKPFEEAFGEPLTWDYLYTKENGREVCRVYVETPGDMHDRESWPSIHTFMIDRMIRMETAFWEVKDYLKG